MKKQKLWISAVLKEKLSLHKKIRSFQPFVLVLRRLYLNYLKKIIDCFASMNAYYSIDLD